MKPKIVQISAVDVSMSNMLALLNERTKQAGYEVHCICSPGENTNQIIENGYYYHPILINRKISPFKNLKSIYRIYKVLKDLKPDIVHVHTPIASVLGRIAAKLAGVDNVIYTAHGFYFHDGMKISKYRLFYNIEKFIGRYFTDYIFTQSEEDYHTAKKNKFLKNRNHYIHISNGIDLNNKYNYNKYNSTTNDEVRNKFGISKKDLLVTFIGRLVKEKGVIDLINAFDQLHDKNIKLIAMGNLPGSERDQTVSKQIMDIEKNNNNINFIGRVNDVERYLYASDVFVLPSYREGMPRSIIEAMAMKNAVIATNIRGSREEVDHNKNGYLVRLKDSEDIKHKLLSLKENPDLLNNMKTQSYKKALNLYDEEKIVSKQIELFNSLIEGDENG